jgi:phosphoribosylformylglycinamidine synthase
MRVREHGKVVADIPNESLTDDAPLYKRPMTPWQPPVSREVPAHVKLGRNGDLTNDFKRLLGSANICSKRWIYEQYDSMVQTNTVEGPGADAGVMRIKDTYRGLAMSLDCNGRWCYLDPKTGAMHAVAEAARNVACVGARPVAATNCLNFGNPEKPPIMQQFAETVDGLAAACEALGTPITGGNVSLYNETLGEGIYPTPTVGVVGIIDDISKVVRHQFAQEGREIIVLHVGLKPTPLEFGSSEFAKELIGELWGVPPAIDLAKEAALQKLIIELVNAGHVESVHDCAEGGLAVALAESAFPRGIGADIDLTSDGLARELALFAETASRIVISCDPKKASTIEQMAVESGVATVRLGRTTTNKLTIHVDGQVAIDASVSELKEVWATALQRALHVDTREHLVPEVLQKS